jgi:hypothetical protein
MPRLRWVSGMWTRCGFRAGQRALDLTCRPLESGSRPVTRIGHPLCRLTMASDAACLQTAFNLGSRGVLFLDTGQTSDDPPQNSGVRKYATHARPAANCCIHTSRALVLDTAPQSTCQPPRRSSNPRLPTPWRPPATRVQYLCQARTLCHPGECHLPRDHGMHLTGRPLRAPDEHQAWLEPVCGALRSVGRSGFRRRSRHHGRHGIHPWFRCRAGQ